MANFLHSAARKKNHKNYYTAIADIEPFIDRNIISGFEIDALTLPGEFTLGLYKWQFISQKMFKHLDEAFTEIYNPIFLTRY